MIYLSLEFLIAALIVNLIFGWVFVFNPALLSLSIKRKKDTHPYPLLLLIWFLGTTLAVGFTETNEIAVDGWLLFVLMQLLYFSTVTDIRYQIISNRVLLISMLIWLFYNVVGPHLLWNLIPALLCTGVFICINLISSYFFERPGFGSGDIKLIAVVALYAGNAILEITFFAVILGGLVSIIFMIFGIIHKKSRLPFAPFILFGSVLSNYVTIL